MHLRHYLFESAIAEFKRQLKDDKPLNISFMSYLDSTESQIRRHEPVNQEDLIAVLVGLRLIEDVQLIWAEPENVPEIFTFLNSFHTHKNPISCIFEAFTSLTKCAPRITAQMQSKVEQNKPLAVEMLNHAWHNYQSCKVVCEPSFSD
jgi:hypothetical protein